MADFEVLYKQVKDLERKLDEKQDELNFLKSAYEKQLQMCQSICPHKKFIAERNGDCHSPGYYYNCECCKYFQTSKPINAEIIY